MRALINIKQTWNVTCDVPHVIPPHKTCEVKSNTFVVNSRSFLRQIRIVSLASFLNLNKEPKVKGVLLLAY